MSTLDYYQNLRSLVSTSVMDNLPQIEDNLKKKPWFAQVT